MEYRSEYPVASSLETQPRELFSRNLYCSTYNDHFGGVGQLWHTSKPSELSSLLRYTSDHTRRQPPENVPNGNMVWNPAHYDWQHSPNTKLKFVQDTWGHNWKLTHPTDLMTEAGYNVSSKAIGGAFKDIRKDAPLTALGARGFQSRAAFDSDAYLTALGDKGFKWKSSPRKQDGGSVLARLEEREARRSRSRSKKEKTVRMQVEGSEGSMMKASNTRAARGYSPAREAECNSSARPSGSSGQLQFSQVTFRPSSAPGHTRPGDQDTVTTNHVNTSNSDVWCRRYEQEQASQGNFASRDRQASISKSRRQAFKIPTAKDLQQDEEPQHSAYQPSRPRSAPGRSRKGSPDNVASTHTAQSRKWKSRGGHSYHVPVTGTCPGTWAGVPSGQLLMSDNQNLYGRWKRTASNVRLEDPQHPTTSYSVYNPKDTFLTSKSVDEQVINAILHKNPSLLRTSKAWSAEHQAKHTMVSSEAPVWMKIPQVRKQVPDRHGLSDCFTVLTM